MVGSRQFFSQLLSRISPGSRPHRTGGGTLWFSDVAPHEEIPGAVEKRITRQSFPSVNPSVTEPLSVLTFHFSGAANPRSTRRIHRQAGRSPVRQPAPQTRVQVQPSPWIRA